MRTHFRVYDEQYVICNFSLSISEVNQVITPNKLKSTEGKKILDKYVDLEIDRSLFSKDTLIAIGLKDITYLLLEDNKPVIGVALFLCLSYINKISLPLDIEKVKVKLNMLKNDINEFERFLHIIEFNYGYAKETEGTISNRYSHIYFDIYFKNKNEIINKGNIDLDILELLDDELDKYINLSIGDEFVLHKNSEGSIIGKITGIVNRSFDELNNIDVLEKLGFNSYKEYYDKMYKAYVLKYSIDLLASDILEFASKHTFFTLSKKAINYYNNKDYVPFKDDNKDYKPKELETLYKMVYYLEMFDKMIDINAPEYSNRLNDKYEKKVYEYINQLELNNKYNINSPVYKYELMKIRFIKYCDNEGIIKGINLEI